jgi:hypothetical protein
MANPYSAKRTLFIFQTTQRSFGSAFVFSTSCAEVPGGESDHMKKLPPSRPCIIQGVFEENPKQRR